MKAKHTIWVVLAVVVIFYFWRYKRAPDIQLENITVENADRVSMPLSTLLTDSCVIICYASWCGPCLKEMRSLANSWASYQNTGITFLAISDDHQDKMDVMRTHMPSEINFLHVSTLKDLGIYSIPATYFLSQKEILHKELEAINWQEYDKIIKYFNAH